jgi:sporulation protein YlmC with PRC-barrel domain
MLTRYLMAGVAGSLLLASASFAAEDQMTSDKTAAPQATAAATDMSFKGDWRASKVVGLNVYNEKNENVGSINDLLMDKSGGIKAAVISVGGFLGMGARLVAIPLDKVKFSTEPIVYTGTAGAPNAGGAKPPGTTTGSAAPAPAVKPNPWYPDHAVINGNAEELKAMPEFKYTSE